MTGDNFYRVCLLGDTWLPPVNGNDQFEVENGYAGMDKGDPIDGVAIDGGVEYIVHIKDGGWLNLVSGYDVTDDEYGYVGKRGEPIDAIMIKDRSYAVSYTEVSDVTDKSSVTDTSNASYNLCTAQKGIYV